MKVDIDFADETGTGRSTFVWLRGKPRRTIGLVTMVGVDEYHFFTWLPQFRGRSYIGATAMAAVKKSGILDVLEQVQGQGDDVGT